MAEESGFSSTASWSEMTLQPKRIDELQREINNVRKNPTAFNLEHNTYNYNIWYSNITSLYSESNAKLTEQEEKDLFLLRDFIKSLLIYKPPHKKTFNDGNKQAKTIFLPKHWEILQGFLFMYEKYTRKYLDKHGLGNPDKEGGDLF